MQGGLRYSVKDVGCGNNDQINAKLKELDSVGVDQFNIYLMTHGQEKTLQAYGDQQIPELGGVTA